MNKVDWLVVQRLLSEKTGERVGELRASPVSGGDINRAYCLSDGQRQYFIKTNDINLLPMFEAEMRGLDEIQRSNSIRVPQVFGCGIAGAQAFIVMEHLDLSGSPNPVVLARQLAAMHRSTQDCFGFSIDNTIGSTPQINNPVESWTTFWQNHRLGYQLLLAKRNGYANDLLDLGTRLNEKVVCFFNDYLPVASLLHGDLWSGNLGADRTGNPVIFDPACYYGDHEADLAMMELFGSPGPDFFDAYHDVFPIDAGYISRRELYNLYHLLNHANLFGGSYVMQAQRSILSLLAQV